MGHIFATILTTAVYIFETEKKSKESMITTICCFQVLYQFERRRVLDILFSVAPVLSGEKEGWGNFNGHFQELETAPSYLEKAYQFVL